MEFEVEYKDGVFVIHSLPSLKIIATLTEKELEDLQFKINVSLIEHDSNKKENV